MTDHYPDTADQLAAGRPFPVRDFTVQLDHHAAVAHLQNLRAWWLDAASYYVEQAQVAANAGHTTATEDHLHDARHALAASHRYTPAKLAPVGA